VITLDNWWPLTLAVIVAVLAVTRATRLIVDDSFPPVDAFRLWFQRKMPGRWAELIDCPWCTAPYLALPAVLWFASLIAFPDWTVNHYIWWIVNGWAAISWLAAYLTMRDVPPESRE
jgi:hypothetical protein